jgi:hypothetical protein
MTTATKWDPYTKAPAVGDCTWEVIFTGVDGEDRVKVEKATGHKDYPEWHGLEFYRLSGVHRGRKVNKRFYGESAWSDSRREAADIVFQAWSSDAWGM